MEKVLLLVIERRGTRPFHVRETIEEMQKLIESSGGVVECIVTALIDKPSPSHYIRSGKVASLKESVNAYKPAVVISSVDLSPTQLRNLEKCIGTRIVDRTGLILDIFARHANTREGKLQIELAQLNYLLPRLSDIWEEFSRLGGGIGTRGPGERQIEVDRRKIRKKIAKIKKELDNVRAHRARIRGQRRRNNMCVVSLVGYTNAGKSTLLNQLTDADVVAQDKLFATLDPTTRKFYLSDSLQILLTDTVGFLKDLPHSLIEAFKATLEEIADSDLILDIVDVSDEYFIDKQKAAHDVLREIKADHIDRITVLNKADMLETHDVVARMKRKFPGAVLVSARTAKGIDELRERMVAVLSKKVITYEH